VNPTERYIQELTRLKPGELGLLRTHAGQGLDESVDGFDLFAGLWWPLQKDSPRAPRREVAWLIAKLYASRPIEHSPDDVLARQMRRSQPHEEQPSKRFQQKFDEMLSLPLNKIEPALRWALDQVASAGRKLDWVQLTDDLSRWQRETTRLKWAKQFLQTEEREQPC
jgi:CRISPR type I-E-associated protein CasB/Cse2